MIRSNNMVRFLIISFGLFVFQNVNFAQQFLQLETINDPESIKYSLGETMLVKTETNDEWHKIKLKEFIYKDSIILLEEGFLKITDITAIRENRPAVNILAKTAQTFGTAYLVYGLLGSLADDGNKIGLGDVAIGGGAIGLGWAFKKAFYQRDYSIGSRYKLRLLDLRIRIQ